jgi:hypothetical protein
MDWSERERKRTSMLGQAYLNWKKCDRTPRRVRSAYEMCRKFIQDAVAAECAALLAAVEPREAQPSSSLK